MHGSYRFSHSFRFCYLLYSGRKLEKAAYLVFFVFLSFILAVLVLIERFSEASVKHKWVWLRAGDVDISFGFEVTALGALMLFIVTLVSLLVHVYSKGYMKVMNDYQPLRIFRTLYICDVRACYINEFITALYILGISWPWFILLIGFISLKKKRNLLQKGFYYDPYWGCWFIYQDDFNFWYAGSFEYDAIFRAIYTGDLPPYMITITAILILSGRWENQVSSRFIRGCQMQWKGQRPFRHLFTRRRWSRLAYI